MSYRPSSNNTYPNATAGPSTGPSGNGNGSGAGVGGAGGNLTRPQFDTVKRLVSQITRAFFDPPWIVILDRMMSKDVWWFEDLARSVGFAKPAELRPFLDLLKKQRLINSHFSHEHNPTWDPSLRRGKKILQRLYWYVDYREFVLSARYRLGAIRERLEGERKVPVENQAAYHCPLCKKQFHELDIPALAQPLPNGDFALVCDVCASEVVQKEEDDLNGMGLGGRDKVDKKNDRLTRWNDVTKHLTETLVQVQVMELESFDVETWLLENVKGTVALVYDERTGRRVLPKEVREESAAVVATTEEEELKRAREALEKVERQRLSDSLPVWHTQSTVSGAETALGLSHKDQTDRRLERAKAAVKEAQVAIDQEADDELEAYYAALEVEGEDDDEDMEEIEPGSAGPSNGSFPHSRSGSISSGNGNGTPRSPAARSDPGSYGDNSDGEEGEDDVGGSSELAQSSVRQSGVTVYVQGKPYRLADIEADEGLIAEMSDAEYTAYEAHTA